MSFGHVNEGVKRSQNTRLTKQCKADAVKSLSRSQRLNAVTVDGLSGGCRNASCGSSFSQKSSSTSNGYSAVKLPVSREHIQRIDEPRRGGAHSSSFAAHGRPKIAHCMRSRPIRYHQTRFQSSFSTVGPPLVYDCLLCAPMSCIFRIPSPIAYHVPRCHRVSLWN